MRKSILFLLISSVLSAFILHQSTMADDLICPEGQYVMLITDDYYYTVEIYNCYGENTCRFSKYIGPHSSVNIVPEKILELVGSFESDFWNLETGKMIGSFPHASARICGDHLIVRKKGSPDTHIYDENGVIVCTLENTDRVQSWEIEGRLYLIAPSKTGPGVEVGILNEETGGLEPVAGECFGRGTAEEYAEIYYFGDNYLICGDGTIRIVTTDWKTVFVTEGYVHRDVIRFYERNFHHNAPSSIQRTWGYIRQVKNKDGKTDYRIYGTDCRLVHIVTEEEARNLVPEFYFNEILMELYQDSICQWTLHGLPCEGTLAGTWEYIPYAITGNTCWYETAYGPVSQEIPQGEGLVSISETFMETRDASGSLHLYDRETGMELTWPFSAEEDGLYLGKNCAYEEGLLYDRNLKPVRNMADNTGRLEPWYDGTFFIRLNAKEGFVSGSDGHWITWRYRERE